MIFRGLLLICICALLFSCEKDEKQSLPETLIGEWEFSYSVDASPMGGVSGTVYDTTYSNDLDDTYSIVFSEGGSVQLKKNNTVEFEYKAYLNFENQCCPGANINYGITLEPNEGVSLLLHLIRNPIELQINDLYPLSEEGVNNGVLPQYNSIENHFIKK